MSKFAVSVALMMFTIACGQSDSQVEPVSTASLLDYSIVEQKMLNDTRIISVCTSDLDNAQGIASEIIAANPDEYMIRVFFYEPGSTPGSDVPLIRYEWTEQSGLTLSFDNRLPEPNEEQNPQLPEYVVLDSFVLMNGRVSGDVLVPSVPRSTSPAEIEQLAIDICQQENIDDIFLYCTEEAYEANLDGRYYEAHPNALRDGYLGSLSNGNFIAGSQLYP